MKLTGGSLYVEMALLAREVYGALPTLSHGIEPLKQGGDITDAAVGTRKWHALSAIELGMKPHDASNPSLQYSLVEGHYQAHDNSNEANATVLSGVVGGKRTVAIVLRGTDEGPSASGVTLGDFADFGSFKNYYDKHKPLIDALLPYLSDAANGVQQVLVSGHSLGAGAIAYLLNALSGPYQVKAFTLGSPGSEVSTAVPQINFIDTDDAVAKVGSTGGSVLLSLLGLSSSALGAIKAKHHSGSNVFIDSDVSDTPGFDAHSSWLYLASVNKLAAFSKDAGGTFYATALAAAIREQRVSGTLTDISVAVGSPVFGAPDNQLLAGNYALFQPIVRGYAGNNFVLGNHGSDDKFHLKIADLRATQSERWFDGATHVAGDTLVLPFVKANYAFDAVAGQPGQYKVTFLGAAGVSKGYVGHLTRIEKIVFADRVDRLDGTEKTYTLGSSERAAIPAYTLKTGYDYVTAGDGKMKITGTAADDVLYVGRGDKTISMGAGNDIVIVKAAAGSKTLKEKITIDGGAGADIMHGGRGAETFVVDNGRDIVTDDGGKDTIRAAVDYRLSDGIETLVLTGSAKIGLGNKAANKLTGNGKANALDGLAGADTISGGSGKDTIAGGAGKDKLTGGGQADTFVFDIKPSSNHVDTITDFKHNTDIIALDDAIFTAIGPSLGKAEFYAKAGAKAAHDADDRIVYNKTIGNLYYDADGKGGVAPVLFATLSSKPTLDHGDFIIA